ncbi:tetratricopeptide repeat protein [Rhodopirellula bahusiensis]|uniref:tetratricopeptide repeat protein n=1 Tax=Rhodopirellula bahusiensis TaxID=2014065 RepID=UPI001E3879EE|nr:tetratricopeptide repeat protein [Rhodopirellula bahusiensis]
MAPKASRPPSSFANEETSETDLFALQDEAAIALENDDHDKAYQLARQVMRLAPNDPSSIFLMARVFGRRNRFPEAIQMLDKLALSTPDARLPVLGQTAQWMVQFGKWKDAEQRFQTLLQEAPGATLVHRELAELFIRQGRTSEATEHLQTLCQQGDIEELELRHLLAGGRPFHGDTSLDELAPIGVRGKTIYAVSRGEWELARTELEALETRPSDTRPILGRIHVHLNDKESLSAWSEEADRVETSNPEWSFPKAANFADQGNHVAAVRLLCEAVLFDQTDSDAYRLLSQSLLAVDRPNESKEAAKRFELISETQRMGREMSLNEDRDDAKLVSLIENLDQLQRPWESLHWCGVRLAYANTNNSLSQNELDRLASQIKERSTRLNNEGWIPDRQFVTCWIDRDSLQQTDAPIDTLPKK